MAVVLNTELLKGNADLLAIGRAERVPITISVCIRNNDFVDIAYRSMSVFAIASL
jgi:hypothetical protein